LKLASLIRGATGQWKVGIRRRRRSQARSGREIIALGYGCHIPRADVLIEGSGTLWRNDGRAPVWGEYRPRVGERVATMPRRRSECKHGRRIRTLNMSCTFSTAAVFQVLMSWLKTEAPYSIAGGIAA
jgi:hypothetical protein